MRQKSRRHGTRPRPSDLPLNAGTPARVVNRRRALARRATAGSSPRRTRTIANRAQRRCAPLPPAPGPFARTPPTRSHPRHAQLVRRRDRRGEQQDLRAPPRAVLVALGLMRCHAGDL
jgi:hypothetical protein